MYCVVYSLCACFVFFFFACECSVAPSFRMRRVSYCRAHLALTVFSNKRRATQVLWEMIFFGIKRRKQMTNSHIGLWWATISHKHTRPRYEMQTKLFTYKIVYIPEVSSFSFPFVHSFIHCLDYIEIKRVNEQTWSLQRLTADTTKKKYYSKKNIRTPHSHKSSVRAQNWKRWKYTGRIAVNHL